jgi:hypothetical protein
MGRPGSSARLPIRAPGGKNKQITSLLFICALVVPGQPPRPCWVGVHPDQVFRRPRSILSVSIEFPC